ncbi:MAG: protein-glutamate O-methyltransferase CheR [Planctomycetota bacterium]
MDSIARNVYRLVEITDKEFDLLRSLIYKRLGINLTHVKRSLLVNRLQRLLREKEFSSFEAYYHYVTSDRSGEALSNLADRISTNHTFFFRENKHFEVLKNQMLPDLIRGPRARKSRMLRVWCAGCSSGEEAYALMMILMDFFGKEYGQWDAGLLATDVSEAALATARAGEYEPDAVEKLPRQWQLSYFRETQDRRYAVIDQIKKEIVFRRFNLMNADFPFKQPFDVIFCRNVMIYFDEPTRESLVKRFFRFTEPGGYLFVGHSESLRDRGMEYEYVMPAVYQKPLKMQ